MKTCTTCGEEKGFELFAKRADNGKYRSSCRDCVNKSNLKRYHTKPETKEAHRRASRKYILKKYGLTQEDFDSLYTKQKGLCAICETEVKVVSDNKYESACVDHCHATGKVRGILCWDCNVGLGKFFDRPDLLKTAADYLQSTR